MASAGRPTGEALLDDLERRGLIHDHTERRALAQRLDDGPTPLYCGFDPTADSLHIGNLQSHHAASTLPGRRAPHPSPWSGGATGMIGDPSGRSEERQFLDAGGLDANRRGHRGPDGPHSSTSSRADQARPGEQPRLDRAGGRARVPAGRGQAHDDQHHAGQGLGARAGSSGTRASRSPSSPTCSCRPTTSGSCTRSAAATSRSAGSDQWGNITAGIDLVRRQHR